MRKIILSILTLVISTFSFAQNFEIGLNGGIGFNSKPDITSDNNHAAAAKGSGVTPAASVKAMYNHRKWQYGLEVGYSQLKYTGMPEFLIGIGIPYYGTYFISQAAFPAKVFMNRKMTLNHFDLYAGIAAGYVLATKCTDPRALPDQNSDQVSGSGPIAGVQAGATYFITRRVGINAEFSADYTILNIGNATYRLFYFPATLGIRFKL